MVVDLAGQDQSGSQPEQQEQRYRSEHVPGKQEQSQPVDHNAG